MIRLLWILGAALVAVLGAVWSYARREESVPGRAGPALLRAAALFLLLAGLALPALHGGAARPSGSIVLLDISRSMTPGARMDSAGALLRRLRPDRVLLFGDATRPASFDSALRAAPTADRSRLAPALETARLAGADSVLVVSDGEWVDRAAAERMARRLGLGVRELRVGERLPRLGLAEVTAPTRVRAGDTVRVTVDLVAAGPRGTSPADSASPGDAVDSARRVSAPGLPDSVRVELVEARDGPLGDLGPAGRGTAAARVPARGRTTRIEFAFVPTAPRSGDVEWRTYELRLPEGADPLGVAGRRRFTLEVSETPGGAVLISTDPDWEPRFLLPRLERAVLGGAVGFLHLGGDRWIEMGARPEEAAPAEVRRASERARLLAVQGRFSELPAWLEARVEAHPRRLLLPRERGPVPGTPLSLAGPLPGEWYPDEPAPPSPIARYLAGIPLDVLPPIATLYRADGTGRLDGVGGFEGGPARAWAPLLGRQGRRGEARPLVVAGRSGPVRWAVATGEGYWRWAGREGPPRRAYEGLVTGLAGWLLEDVAPRQVELRDPAPGRRLRWRVAPDVRDLRLAVREGVDGERWSASFDSPPPEVEGPALEPGRYVVVAEGTGAEGPFRRERPLELAADPSETLPRALDEPMVIEPAARLAPRVRVPRAWPVWPFLAAVLLLCGEWTWRRRIGLR